MKNLFTVDFANNSIIATKTTLKKASVPNSNEYKALMKLTKQHPTFSIVEKEIKAAEGKETFKGLNKVIIEKYISIQPNAADLQKQYGKAVELGKFPLVRKWFLNTFEGIKMEAIKEAIEEATLGEIAKASANKQTTVAPIHEATAA